MILFYVPDLRFDFNDIWKPYQLKEISSRVIRKNKGNISRLVLTISAENGLVDQEEFFNRKIASSNIEGYYLLENGEFAYNKSYSKNYPWGAVKRLDAYDKGVVSTLYICFKLNDRVKSDFMTHYFESNKWNNGVSEIAVEGARNHGLLNIPINDYFNTIHFLPSELEQSKIASFFNIIEARIITQKKIISKIESQIKTIKSQIFSHNIGAKKSMQDILDEVSIKSSVNNQYPVISSTVKGLVLQSEYFDKEIASPNNKGYKIITKNNIIISPQNLWMGNITFNDKFENGIVSPSYKIFNVKEGYNKLYIFEIMTTKKSFYLYKTVSEQGASVVRRNLNFEAFMQLTYNIPSIEEQNKIIENLYLLKNKYENEKKILSLYEKQKQYLLNKMFI